MWILYTQSKNINFNQYNSTCYRLVIAGSYNDADWMIIKTSMEYPTAHKSVDDSSDPLAKDPHFVILSSTTAISLLESRDCQSDSLFAIPMYTISQNPSDQYISDVAYFSASYENLDLVQNKAYELKPLMICSNDGSTAIIQRYETFNIKLFIECHQMLQIGQLLAPLVWPWVWKHQVLHMTKHTYFPLNRLFLEIQTYIQHQ